MRKQFVMGIACAVCVLALAGCGSKKPVNDYASLTNYKGVEVEQVKTKKVTDTDIQNEIDSRLAASAKVEDAADKEIEKGDIATIDYKGTVEGEKTDIGSADNYQVEVGSGAMLAGFEDQLIGHKKGDSFEIQIKLPKEDENVELAGKTLQFQVKINQVGKKQTPELTDEWVKKNSTKAKNIADYKKEIKSELKRYYGQQAREELTSKVLEEVVKNATVKKYPKHMDENLTEQEKKEQVVLDLVAETEGLTLSDEEYKTAAKEYAKSAGLGDQKAAEKSVGKKALKKLLLQEKTKEWLVDNCKQVGNKK